jgi:hypothetical protein
MPVPFFRNIGRVQPKQVSGHKSQERSDTGMPDTKTEWSLVDRTTELSDEVLPSVESGQRAIGALYEFVTPSRRDCRHSATSIRP